MAAHTRYDGTRTAMLRASLFAVMLLSTATNRLAAQDSMIVRRGGWAVGGSLGMLGYGSQAAPLELTTVGVHFTQLRPGSIGADISLGTMPRAMVEGVVLLGVRVGVTVPVQVAPGVLLLPSAGATVIGAGGMETTGGAVGYNLGGAAVFGPGPIAFRTGLTRHQLQDLRGGFWLLEVGIVHLPRL